MRLDSFENLWSKFGITNDVILLNNVTVLRSGCTYHSFVTIVGWVKDGLFLTLIICIAYNVVRKVNGWLTKGWINQEQLWSKQTWMEKRQEIDENQLPWHGVLKCIRSRVNLAKRIIYLYSLIIAILGFSDSLLIFTSCILWSSFPQFSLSLPPFFISTLPLKICTWSTSHLVDMRGAPTIPNSWRDNEKNLCHQTAPKLVPLREKNEPLKTNQQKMMVVAVILWELLLQGSPLVQIFTKDIGFCIENDNVITRRVRKDNYHRMKIQGSETRAQEMWAENRRNW